MSPISPCLIRADDGCIRELTVAVVVTQVVHKDRLLEGDDCLLVGQGTPVILNVFCTINSSFIALYLE